jgi:predicted nucleotidyltransferase
MGTKPLGSGAEDPAAAGPRKGRHGFREEVASNGIWEPSRSEAARKIPQLRDPLLARLWRWSLSSMMRGNSIVILGASEVGFKIMNSLEIHAPDGIREDVLKDTRYPLHQIGGRLLPYLRVLRDKFHPERVVVFGSYAHGTPDRDSDVDLLVVKRINKSRIKDKLEIRSAWWPILKQGDHISFDLMLAEPEDCNPIGEEGNTYLGRILAKGVRVL